MLECTPNYLDMKMTMKKTTGTIKTLFLYIGHALRTVFQLYQSPYSKEWDTLLNELLDALENGKCSAEIHDCVLQINCEKQIYDVWVANRWYAYGNLYMTEKRIYISEKFKYRPKFSTMIRLNDVVTNLENIQRRVKLNELYDSIRENLK